MKLAGEYIKYYRGLIVFSLLAVIFLVEIKAMKMSPKAMQYSQNLIKKFKREGYTVYGFDSEKGVSF